MKSASKFMIKAVFTVTFFTVIDRVLGFGFKIYLSRELGAVNMGVYQVALSIFFMLLTVTTSGVPLVISKLTAKYEAEKTPQKAGAIVSAALITGSFSAVILCIITLALNKPIGSVMASPESMTVLFIMLPGVVFSGIYSAFKGNLWGKQRYTVMSVIEVIEQISRIILTVILFLLGFNKLKVTALSLSVSCGVSAICCASCFFAYKGRLSSPKGSIAPLIKSSAPITVVRASNSIVNSVIAIIVPIMLVKTGYSSEQALYIYGSSVGMAMPLLYIPITVVGSLAYVMIPTLSSAYSTGNLCSAHRQINTAVKFAALVAAVFVPAFCALGGSIGKFVYANDEAGKFLVNSAWLLIPVSVENIASSMLNSLDLEKQGFINYMIGSAVLFGIMGAFYKSFCIEVMSAGLGISLTVASILDLICIKKRTGIKYDFIPHLIIAVLLIYPATFLTKTAFALMYYVPLIVSITVSAVIGCAFMILTFAVFGIIDLGIIRGKKISGKRVKSVAKNR